MVKSEKSKRARAERKSSELSATSGGHGKERSDSSNITITPGSFVRRNSKFHFVDEEDEGKGISKDAYPSPPDTPPETERASTKQLAPLDTSSSDQRSSSTPYQRSPPLASPLQPRYNPASPSQSSTHLSTQNTTTKRNHSRRTSLSSFRTTSSSILSRFKDPSTGLLRRVESSTSVCTVPPDFGATRLRIGDKGKGKAIDPSTLGLGGMRFGKGEMVGLGPVEEERKVGKSWLGRFFSVSGLTPLREREHSSVRERLRDALKRDQEKELEVEYVMDWGDGEEPTEDEDEEDQPIETTQPPSSPSSPEPEVRRTSPSPSPTPALSPTATARPPNPRRRSSQKSLRSPRSKRSFVLGDPTTASPSPSSTDSLVPPSPSSQSSRHRRHPSSSSSSQFLSPLSATKPKKPVSIDPLLLELERSSRVGVRTVCQSCKKKGLNFPACRKCGKNYCSRNCRMDGKVHECANKESTRENGVEAKRVGVKC